MNGRVVHVVARESIAVAESVSQAGRQVISKSCQQSHVGGDQAIEGQ